MMLPLPEVTSDKFSWCGPIGVADASDLGRHIPARVYDDACDAGFILKSTRSGRRLLMTECDAKRDIDNDVIAWRYACAGELIDGRLRDYKGLVTLEIVND